MPKYVGLPSSDGCIRILDNESEMVDVVKIHLNGSIVQIEGYLIPEAVIDESKDIYIQLDNDHRVVKSTLQNILKEIKR